ncbi:MULTISPECIES: NUDIX hydrolase [Gordonia]|uniref:CoA pyrophosphatase n=1 Tax=Gordonia cholesterolivorans TaxID=559625 RepID=A0ABP5U544_9ACTN|nr:MULTISPECIES: CoA pyrophosphatase [Gordonia]AUH67733.1 CoA pyrophosphatase [Gordonia sp. YC-JH1]KJR09430.1 NUDIX hydrolase [Gordonia sihwensis]KXT58210.1 NUDIX hydrolase [Gordonia sp. QH-12]WFN92588.1 CoA pyrophosphatase [Gordonia sihwensis]
MSGVPVGPLVSRDQIPPWLRPVTDDPEVVNEKVLSRGGGRARLVAGLRGHRAAAVLVLFAGSFAADPLAAGGLPADADVLLTERAATLRTHSGQIAFPGGSRDPGDDYPVGTALREAREETGLTDDGVKVLANLPAFPVPTGFEVHPVLAHWERPSHVYAVDHGETARVTRVNLRELLAPENRFQVSRSLVGTTVYKGPAFLYDGMLVWGFTGGLLAAISEAAGWDVPWDTDDVRPLEQMIAETGGRQVSGFSDPRDGGLAADVNGDR